MKAFELWVATTEINYETFHEISPNFFIVSVPLHGKIKEHIVFVELWQKP